MGVASSLRSAVLVGGSANARARWSVSFAALCERLTAVGLALAIAHGRHGAWLYGGVAFATSLTARVLSQSALLAATEVTASIVRGDVLQQTLLPDEDARSTLLGGLHQVARLLAAVVPNLWANLIAAVPLSVVLLFVEPFRASLAAAGALAIGAAAFVASRRVSYRAQSRAWSSLGSLVDAFTDASESRLELVAMGQGEPFLERFGQLARTWQEHATRAVRIAAAMGRLPLLLLALAAGVAVIVDARLRDLGWAEALGHAAILTSCAPTFVGLAQCVQQLEQDEHRLLLVSRVLESARPTRSGMTPPPRPILVDWVDVSFGYAGNVVLQRVSLTWQAGEVLALTGPNGSGKTTLTRTLLGLASPAEGTAKINGEDLSRLDGTQWRRRIAFLPQRPYLAARATVRDCMRFFDDHVPEPLMVDKLRRVGVWSALERSSPEPLSVRIGSLSVGQRQRVALARMLCRDAPMVVLDEPDANLDRDGIALVANLVTELAHTRMVLVVAHSPELLSVADRIVTLDAGRIVSDVRRSPRSVRLA